MSLANAEPQPDSGSSHPPDEPNTVFKWFKKNFFSSWLDCAITTTIIIIVLIFLIPFVKWALLNAAWVGTDRRFCTTIEQGGFHQDGWSGACWAFVKSNFTQIIYGRYPSDQRWRVNLVAVATILINIPLFMPSIKHKVLNLFLSIIVVPLLGGVILYGGAGRLLVVDTALWGGAMVTVIICYTSIAFALPLGTLLALGRRSSLFLIRWSCIFFIELLRGIPLITILFIASILFPLFLPSGMSLDKLLRALVAIALFTSVYIAEVLRGGLQAIPKSQLEGAYSLGLKYWYSMIFIILPQVYRLSLPGILNTIIGMMKETSLIYVISMFDLLGIVQQLSLQATWISPQTPNTAYLFAGTIFWILCFGVSRYGSYLENRLNSTSGTS